MSDNESGINGELQAKYQRNRRAGRLSSSPEVSDLESKEQAESSLTASVSDEQQESLEAETKVKEEELFLDYIESEIDEPESLKIIRSIMAAESLPELLAVSGLEKFSGIKEIDEPEKRKKIFFDLLTYFEDCLAESDLEENEIDQAVEILLDRYQQLEAKLAPAVIENEGKENLTDDEITIISDELEARARRVELFLSNFGLFSNLDDLQGGIQSLVDLFNFNLSAQSKKIEDLEVSLKAKKKNAGISEINAAIKELSRLEVLKSKFKQIKILYDQASEKFLALISNLDADNCSFSTFFERVAFIDLFLSTYSIKKPSSDFDVPKYKSEIIKKIDIFIQSSAEWLSFTSLLDSQLFSLNQTELIGNNLNTEIQQWALIKQRALDFFGSTFSLFERKKSLLFDICKKHFIAKVENNLFKIEGINFSETEVDLDEFEQLLLSKPNQKKYGISDVSWLKERIEAFETKIKAKLSALEKSNQDKTRFDKWQTRALKLLNQAKEICRGTGGYSETINGAPAIEKKLLRQSSIDDILMSLWFDGISAQDAELYLKPRLEFLKDKVVSLHYQAQIDLVEQDQTLDSVQKANETSKILAARDYFFLYLDRMYDQIGYSLFANGNVNLETFQDHTSGGSSKLIGKLNSDGSIEKGLWANAEKWAANVRFNKEVLGIRHGFDDISQRNTDSEAVDINNPDKIIETKMQTIIAEITAVIANETGNVDFSFITTEEITIAGKKYHPGDTIQITNKEYNVDSVAVGASENGSVGDELVRKLVAKHRKDLFKYDSDDVVASYIRGIKFFAARNDILSTQFIKMVGLQNKSLYSTCGDSLRPFGIGCAQTRALFKDDAGGYLSLSDSLDMELAVTRHLLYQKTAAKLQQQGLPPFYDKIKLLQELYDERELVDYPQKGQIARSKDIFRPKKWHQGFVSRGYVACSIGEEIRQVPGRNGQLEDKPHTVTSNVYLDAAAAMQKIIDASTKEIEVGSVSIENLSGFFTSLSSQFSIVLALSGGGADYWQESDADKNPLWHINAFMISLLETYTEKILTNTSGNRRYGSVLDLPEAAGRQYEEEHRRIKSSLKQMYFDFLKNPVRDAVISFMDRTDFMRPKEYSGIRAKNNQGIANYRYNTWVENNFIQRAGYQIETWRVLERNANRYAYPKEVLHMDPKKIWAPVITADSGK